MHAYDRFIEEASHRLGLGHRTRWVVDVIAGWIASHPRGLDGLEQTFEQAGLGVHFRSWRRPGQPPLPVLASDLQRALGDPVMDRLARRSRLSSGAFRVVAYDFGIQRNILRLLVDQGLEVEVVPARTSAADVLARDPDGIFLSNGPGDPAACGYAIENIRALLGQRPIFGICLGHQLLALAMGGRTYKLKFGHRGGNQPVRDLQTGRIEITSQNHGFAVDVDSLGPEVEATHLNLNDGTNEGLRHRTLPAFGVQYHPEASPGPHDADYLFGRFRALIEAHR